MEIKQYIRAPTIVEYGEITYLDEVESYIIQSVGNGFVISYVGEHGDYEQKFFETLKEAKIDVALEFNQAEKGFAEEYDDTEKLKRLTIQRNKLNRQIASLKKAHLQN
jgi:hypothetical protein